MVKKQVKYIHIYYNIYVYMMKITENFKGNNMIKYTERIYNNR